MSSLASLIKNPNVLTLPSSATVMEAAEKMSEHLIGSIVVVDGDALTGIFTERDLLNRVVAKGLDAKKTRLAEVMSKHVTTVSIQQSVESCYQQMQESKCRHIPLVDGKKLVGVVTMRNILEWLTQEIKEENVFLKNFIQG
jgi:CBS domain-containing protein